MKQGVFSILSRWSVKFYARHGCVTNGPFDTQEAAMRSYILAVAVLGPSYAGEKA